MARQIKEISAADYYTKYWTAKAVPTHNAWWDNNAALTNIEKLPIIPPGKEQYRLTLSNGQTKVVAADVILWLEIY